MFSNVLRSFYGALRVDLVVLDGFARVPRSSTRGAVFSFKVYESSTELYRLLYVVSKVLRGLDGALRVDLCGFEGFTQALLGSRAGSMCFWAWFYERSMELDGSTELYGFSILRCPNSQWL